MFEPSRKGIGLPVADLCKKQGKKKSKKQIMLRRFHFIKSVETEESLRAGISIKMGVYYNRIHRERVLDNDSNRILTRSLFEDLFFSNIMYFFLLFLPVSIVAKFT